MRKEKLSEQIGWAYFWLTLIVVLFGSYLKLTGEIKISWWWVTFPAWGSLAGALIVIGTALIVMNIINRRNEK